MSGDRKYADLHIHSKFSRACSRDCDLEHLAWWAGRKGISVVGTGDFTHPVWREELGAKLVPDAPGLFRLRPDLERAVHDTLPPACRAPVRFMLSSEISTIYKRDDRTRKVHHLLYAPSLDAVDEITRALARVGNLASDGRPILGLDSRNLLEITLSGGDGCYLIPAHAWTPWFAVLGSQSGFDRVADCYADLADHIFAIETGLSSDPEMNWRVSSLDGYRLVSNSDAHSPPMLGREATAFELAEPDYFGIYQALRTGDGFGGTVEFFPEEGKYHLDGHRACDVRMTPEETREAGGKCPACGKKPTIGVQHRVDVLADRPEGHRLAGAAGFASFVPLPEILGEIAGVGPKSKSVAAQVSAMVDRFGPELGILGDVPLDDLAAGAPSIVAEAIARLRRGDVRRDAGYDGVYGTIRLFDPDELAGAALFDVPRAPRKPARRPTAPGEAAPPAGAAAGTGPEADPLAAVAAEPPPGLDPEQHAIATHDGGPLLVVAGPGAGKTRVLTHAIAHRIDAGLPPERCLAVTFTRRARDELRDRLTALLGADAAARVTVATFHGLGLVILREQGKLLGLDTEPKVADEKTRDEILRSLSPRERPSALGARIGAAKRVRASTPGPAVDPAADPAAMVPATVGPVVSSPANPAAMVPATVGPVVSSPANPAAMVPATVGPAVPSPANPAATVPATVGPAAPSALGDEPVNRATPADDADLADLADRYDAALRERGLVDLDDLVTLPATLLAGDPALAAEYRARWTDVFVDEYQDVDEQQYLMLRQLAAPGARICAIGDPDQAIYGFRGGDVGYFLRFGEDFGAAAGEAPAVTVRLSRSYRSAPTIVRAAMQLIRPGTLVPGRELIPARTDIPDGPVVVHAVADEREEAEAIAAEIEKLIGGASFHALDSRAVDGRDRTEHQLSFADFAVLYRTSSQAAAVDEALARRGFPVQRRSHSRLAEMPGVPEILAALALFRPGALPIASAPTDAPPPASASGANGCGIEPVIGGSMPQPSGEATVAELLSEAVRITLAESVSAPVTEETRRAEALVAIKTAADVLGPLAARCGSDLDRFLDELALGAEVDTWDPRADRISLLTLHAAKGLEFPVVFIVGCDDGLLPLRPWRGAEVDYAEERRLLFVGMTRATTRLTLFTAAKRTLRGELTECSPSPFLASVDQALLDRRGGGADRGRRKPRAQQTTLF